MPRYTPDLPDDYDSDYTPLRPSSPPKPEGSPSLPEPILFDDLIEQFIDEYAPVSFEEDAELQMDISNLRDYFGAWPQYGYPDAIPAYLEALRRHGFRLRTNFEHQPVLFLRPKELPLLDEAIDL